MSSHKLVPEVHGGVSTDDVPSAAFGWSRTPHTGVQVAGWITVLILLGYNFGNHHGHVETIYLFLFAALIAIGLIIDLFQPKMKQVRTITARNQPEGYQELDWTYEQKTVGGPYAELTDSQLRALNIEPSRVSHLRVGEAVEATGKAVPTAEVER